MPKVTFKQRVKDAFPDRVDIRDWPYQPHLRPLPDVLVNTSRVPRILDQGREGACTGFALAAVVNFLLGARRGSASPRMLYEMARRYDEWPGEDYEGSSARGAMKGFVRHGVCDEKTWPVTKKGTQHFTPVVSAKARLTPGGAYYRVSHGNVRDLHAALSDVGVLYMTLMVHPGWDTPGPTAVVIPDHDGTPRRLLVIERRGRADGGHAVAIVGYTKEGFILQNSWGTSWGSGGFALLPYEDYLIHATDVWVAQLGVPVQTDLWLKGAADTSSGIHRASAEIGLEALRPYVIDIGNNGRLSDSGDYWTTEHDVETLVKNTIPSRAAPWKKRRTLLYLHGGLNSEKDAAKRVVAFEKVLLANEIYPVHIMWETGAMESIRSIVDDLFHREDTRAGGVRDWWDRFRERLSEAKDRTLELTLARPGRALWDEMKENARLASGRPDGLGAMEILAKHTKASLGAVSAKDRASWELHVVAHSAGSIFAAHALRHFQGVGIPVKTFHLMAPAITEELYRTAIVPALGKILPKPTVYVLSDAAERKDSVSVYGKSLLYLVSNAFEAKRETPILGMETFLSASPASLRATMAVVTARPTASAGGSRSSTHGGFDNDPVTMNSILTAILGGAPPRPFTDRDLAY